MELTHYLRTFRAHWVALTVLAPLCAVAAVIYGLVQQPVYSATSSGLVTFGPAADANTAHANDVLSKSRAESYVGLAKDRATASIVIEQLDLDQTPEALVDDINVDQIPDTVLIRVSARADSADGAQELADTWIAALAQRVDDIESVEGDQGLRIEVAESALRPSDPVSPRIGRNVLAAAVLGALLSAGYVVARTILDRRLRSQQDIEAAAGVAVVGRLPHLPSAPGVVGGPDGKDAWPLAAEEVRRLRTNLAHMDDGKQPRSIVVTSPSDGDGKTTVATNLAVVLAGTGQRVTLVDADLRHADRASAHGLVSAPGLTDVLVGDAQLDEAVRPYPGTVGLEVLTAGNLTTNPSELLSSDSMVSIIEQLAARGTVVIDATSLLPVTDAAIVGHLADGVLVVVDAGATRDTELTAAVNHLRTAQARLLGIVVNRGEQERAGRPGASAEASL